MPALARETKAAGQSVKSALVLSLNASASVESGTPGAVFVIVWDQRITFHDVGPGVRRAFQVLAGPGATEDEFATAVLREEGPPGLAAWCHYLSLLEERGAISYALRVEGVVVMRLCPISGYFRAAFPLRDPDTEYVLSRFAFWRREGERLVIESPMSLAKVELSDARALVLAGAFRRPASVDRVQQEASTLPPWAVAGFVSLLDGAGMLTVAAGSGDAAEDRDPRLLQWEPVDLLFHARSRLGRHQHPMGGTYRFRDRLPPAPVAKAPMSDRTMELHRPDVAALSTGERPFTAVLEDRRSIRTYGSDPMTATELGDFLYRVARVKGDVDAAEVDGAYAATSRPYPSGGACYGLELYPVVSVSHGLEPGLYHYDAMGHRLEALPDPERHHRSLLEDARLAMGGGQTPQVLIVIAARFPRVFWKYESVGYALILKEVGALYQTMYLVATAMHLAPCALGAGNVERFALATGADFHEEGSVGEFALGRRPAKSG